MNGFTDLIQAREPFILIVAVSALGVLSHLLSVPLSRKKESRQLYAFFLLFYFLFARMMFTALKDLAFPLLRPLYFFAASVALGSLVFYALGKTGNQQREKFISFLRVTLFVLIIYEASGMMFGKTEQPFTLKPPVQTAKWKGAGKPNIYVLLFDEYQGNKGLKKMTGYDNNALIEFLQNERFRVASEPLSPYRTTIYAIPSLFRMDTLAFTTAKADLSKRSAVMANKMLKKENTFIEYLQGEGYRTECMSLFGIGNDEPVVSIPIGISWLELQLLKILPWWAQNDLFHAVPSNSFQKMTGTLNAHTLSYNRKILDNTLSKISRPDKGPRFLFSHFLLPHPPVLLDSTGSERALDKAMYENNVPGEDLKKAYLEQLTYVNGLIRQIITKIDREDPGSTVLIISDHGFRGLARDRPETFNIQWAMRTGYNTVIADEKDLNLVNAFRILLNNIAGQQLPMVTVDPKY